MKKIEDLVEIKGLFCLKISKTPYSGKVEGEAVGTFKDGLPDGIWREYSKDGILLSETNYENGILNGKFFNYFREGQLKEKGFLLKGKLEGELLEFYKTG